MIHLKKLLVFLIVLGANLAATAQVKLPALVGDNMVLQQNAKVNLWGWASPNEKINIQLGWQTAPVQITANSDGTWKTTVNTPQGSEKKYNITIEATNKINIQNILVGEVWICSGQSNMEWPVKNTNSAELAILTANAPNIRLITVPRVGTDQIKNDFEGAWTACTPESVKDFSAIGYFFGRRLCDALNVPIGLIDDSWGGSAAEAWVNKDILLKDPKYNDLMAWWKDKELHYNYELEVTNWKKSLEAWEALPSGLRNTPRPQRPGDLMSGNQRPANIYNGVLHPTIGYGIKGVIWYQGESNAGRAYQYRDLFPLMIQNWREEWGQGDFPFYYVQLADFQKETDMPGESSWAELREAQTMTMDRLSNTGQAVIIDLGEGRDIHPRHKQTVADRLARWALAKDYNKGILFSGPTYQTMQIDKGKIILTFNNVGQGLYAFDTPEPKGFAIAGEDKRFEWAEAKIISSTQMEVWSDHISNPVAIRYAWADNPVCNMYSRDGLPMIPFRTDDWPGITFGKTSR